MNNLPKVGDTIHFGFIPTIGDYEVGLQYNLSNGDLVTIIPSYLNKTKIKEGKDYHIDKINFESDFSYGYLDARHHVLNVIVSERGDINA